MFKHKGQSSKKFSLNDETVKIFPVCHEKRIYSLNEFNERDNISSVKMCNDNNFIQKLYYERISADSELIFKNGYSEKVHKFVIASHSKYILKNLFKQTSIPSYQSVDSDEEQLEHISYLGLSTSDSTKSLGSKDPYRSEKFGSLSSLGTPRSLSSSNYKRQSSSSLKSIESKDLLSSEKTEKLRYFEECSGECGKLLVELFYRIKVDWNKYQLEFIIEALKPAQKFKMNYVKTEIFCYLNGVSVNKRNHVILEEICKTMQVHLQELHKKLTYFKTDHLKSSLEIVDYDVIEGENSSIIKNLEPNPDEKRRACTYHKIGNDSKILLKFRELSKINGVKMRLYDQKLRSYSYSIEVSEDCEKWVKIVDYSTYQCRSWQILYFPEKLVKFMRIFGNKCYDTIEWNYFEVTSIEIFKTNEPMKTIDGILNPNENMAKSSHGAKLLRGLNLWIIENESDNTKSDSLTNFTYHMPYNDILIQLSQVIITDNMKIVTWDHIEYEFVISVSFDNKVWSEVYRYPPESVYPEEYTHKSKHEIVFKPQRILFIRIFGENIDNNDEMDDTFRVVSFKCPDL